MKRFYRALLCLTATWGMSPAMAGDLYVPEVASGPPPPPVVPPVPYLPPPRWFGPYAGLNLGFEWGNLTNLSVNPTGVIAGAQVGYNWQYGQFVFGAESDMQLSDADGTFASFQFSSGLVRRVDERATPTVGRCFMQPQDLRMGRLSSSLPV
jgi:outer membrane immunogenic protein